MAFRFRYVIFICAILLTFGVAPFVDGQNSSNVAALRNQVRARYDVIALRDGVGLVPHEPSGDIRLIEIRNGVVSINGNAITSREARERLGQDAEIILRVTYLDSSALRELVRADSTATPSQPETGENANEAEPVRTGIRRGDLVRIGGGVTVARDEVVEGDVVSIGGSADIDGEVARDVTVVGGSLNLGPDSLVRGDIAVIGGTLNRSPGARVYGKADNVGFGAQFPFNRRLGRRLPFRTPVSQSGRLIGTALRMTLLILSALVIVALGGRLVDAVADRAATEPLRAGLAGLLAEVVFLPLLVVTIVVLAVSIIGIPLLLLVPFGIVLAVVLMLVGFAGIARQVGRLLSGRLGLQQGPYASVALGVVAVVGITLVARIIALAGGFMLGLVVAGSLAAIGYLAEYVAWTMGIGAVILTWLNRRRNSPVANSTPPTPGEAHAG